MTSNAHLETGLTNRLLSTQVAAASARKVIA